MLFEAEFRSPVAPQSGSLITIEKKCTHGAQQVGRGVNLLVVSAVLHPLIDLSAIVLLTAPSLRSDGPPSFENLSKALRRPNTDLAGFLISVRNCGARC
jgi:hypothetical protein